MAGDMQFAAQRIVPMIVYSDAAAALDFLCRAFGFEERFRMEMPDGSIGHAEVAYGENVVMVASTTDGDESLGVPNMRAPKTCPRTTRSSGSMSTTWTPTTLGRRRRARRFTPSRPTRTTASVSTGRRTRRGTAGSSRRV